MGLDWNPGPKAKSGFEAEFTRLWTRLHARHCFFRDRKTVRFKEITLSAFETLAAPRVGIDPRADNWAREKYPKRTDKNLSEEEWFRKLLGFYVVELVGPCDGLPRYSNGSVGGYVERFSFRGQFLKDCTDIIGPDILNSAWVSKPPDETRAYGDVLLGRALDFSRREKIDLTTINCPEDSASREFHLDVVLSAARWCHFWSERGHWLEAYF